MPQYTLLDPLTGSMSKATAQVLTRRLQVNRILLLGEAPIGIITHRDIVLFNRWCAGQILSQRCHRRTKLVPSEAMTALALVDRWSIDPNSVSNEELERASKAAAVAAAVVVVGSRTNAAGDVTHAAYAAAGVAYTASDAAQAAADVAHATTYAIHAARHAKAAGVSFETQARWLVQHLRSSQ